MNAIQHKNDLIKIPAAACRNCGGWTSVGGMSQYSTATEPVDGRTGCTCGQKSKIARGSVFYMGRIKCTVNDVLPMLALHGPEQHVGFTWKEDVTGTEHSGWMPLTFVEQFTGH